MLFWFSRLAVTVAYHMLIVAIGWTIYDLTNSALDLGLVGLIQFVPNVILTLLVGHAADRYDRRYIVIAAQVFYALAALTVLVVLVSPVKSVNLLFLAVLVLGCARAFELPAGSALVPALVPQALISRAVAAWASANQTAVICGPAAGGLIYAFSPALVCVLAIAFCVIGHGARIADQGRAPAGAARAAKLRFGAGGLRLHPHPAAPARHHHARSYRRAVRRRCRAVSDLCPRHPRCRSGDARPAALGARNRRAR